MNCSSNSRQANSQRSNGCNPQVSTDKSSSYHNAIEENQNMQSLSDKSLPTQCSSHHCCTSASLYAALSWSLLLLPLLTLSSSPPPQKKNAERVLLFLLYNLHVCAIACSIATGFAELVCFGMKFSLQNKNNLHRYLYK